MKEVVSVAKKALNVWKTAGFSVDRTPIARLAWQGLPYLTDSTGGARAPLTVYWSINSVCNLHCRMCDVGTANADANFWKILRIDKKLHEIPIELFKSVTDELAPTKPRIAINATEPLMYKPLAEAVRYVRSKDMHIGVTTGGYLLPDKAEELADAGLNRLNVSIDGPPDIHNTIRGRKDVFQKATDGIRKFDEAARKRGLKSDVALIFTVTNMNHGSLVAFMDSIADLPVSIVSFNWMTFITPEQADHHNAVWGEKYKATETCLSSDVHPSRVDTNELWKQMAEIKKRKDPRVTFNPEYNREELERFFHDPETFMDHTPCMSSWHFAQILADGDCIPFTRCYHVSFGNIHEQKFMDIWNGDKVRAWRKDLRKEKRFPACSRCPLVS